MLAAAIHGGAAVIGTVNLRHFPADALDAYGLKACDPDKFVRDLLDDHPEEVVEALNELQRDLKNPPVAMSELLARLERQGLARTSGEVRRLTGLT